MSEVDQGLDLRTRVAEHLAGQAHAITEEWLERLEELRGHAAFRHLSVEEAKDHIPVLLASVARDIEEGAVAPPPESTRRYLSLHVEMRRHQGYTLEHVLEEFESLPVLVGAEIAKAIASTRDGDIEPAGGRGGVYQLAYNKLALIGAAAARIYAEAGAAERRRLLHRLNDFASTLEHEIRNPLNTAVVTSELLRKDEIAQQPKLRHEWVDRLQTSLEEVKELIAETRRLSIAEEALLEDSWASCSEVLSDVYDQLQEMAGLAEVELRRGMLPEGGIWVRLPHVKLAIRNLVANAIKYSDPEKQDRWVSVSCEQSGDTFYISVQDNGLGIPADQVEKVFESGVRAHPQAGRGSGLGLSIVSEVLEQRGGSVSVESRVGEGSTFRLELPFPLASDEEPGGRSE